MGTNHSDEQIHQGTLGAPCGTLPWLYSFPSWPTELRCWILFLISLYFLLFTQHRNLLDTFTILPAVKLCKNGIKLSEFFYDLLCPVSICLTFTLLCAARILVFSGYIFHCTNVLFMYSMVDGPQNCFQVFAIRNFAIFF